MKRENDRLAGRIAVVTGASSGIGEATARALAAEGAKVAVLARRADRLEALATTIREGGGEAFVHAIDVTSREGVERAAAAVVERFGRIDVVVNNAGIMLPNPIEAARYDQWKTQVDLNVNGMLHVAGAFVPHLVRAGADGHGADLVNVSSVAARNVYPAFAVYSATKAFVSHFSVHLRAELGGKGVRVSAIEPGIVATELQGHVDFQGARDWLDGARAQMEFLSPEDVAAAIAFTVGLPERANVQTLTLMPTGMAT